MNTTKIIKALETENLIKYDNEFEKKYDCSWEDYFDILEEKTPFRFIQVPRKNGNGFHHKPFICMA